MIFEKKIRCFDFLRKEIGYVRYLRLLKDGKNFQQVIFSVLLLLTRQRGNILEHMQIMNMSE